MRKTAYQKEVAFQNKDITSKLLAEGLKEKSFEVYGVNTPKVKEVLPTNLPRVAANELRLDNLFLLEDETLAIFDYESKYTVESKIKYINYIARVYEKYHVRYPGLKLRMIVIYTCDVQESTVNTELDIGCLQIRIEAGYLSNIDSKAVYEELKSKIENGVELEDEDIMRLIILPLTVKGAKKKEQMVERVVTLAKQITNENQKVMAIAGIVTFADKIISRKYSNQLKEMIRMTKVAQLFEEEKIAAVKQAKKEVAKEVTQKVTKQGIKALVETCMDFGATQEVTQEKIMKKFDLSQEKAQEAIEQYWK